MTPIYDKTSIYQAHVTKLGFSYVTLHLPIKECRVGVYVTKENGMKITHEVWCLIEHDGTIKLFVSSVNKIGKPIGVTEITIGHIE